MADIDEKTDAVFSYDVAISFAGEQRPEAQAIAAHLQVAGFKVFYDGYEQATLWGKDLYQYLSEIYKDKARYCLMLVSAAYAAKVWPSHERQSAQARALSQKVEYILPVRFDETEIPGLLSTAAYLRFEEHGVEGVCALVVEKLGIQSRSAPSHALPKRAEIPDSDELFLKQRKRLMETEILTKIWAKPRWQIWIRPTEFRKARFRNGEDARDFVFSSFLRLAGRLTVPVVFERYATGWRRADCWRD